MLTVIGVVVGLLVVGYLVNSGAMNKVFGTFRAMMGSKAADFKQSRQLDVVKQAIEDRKETLARAKQALKTVDASRRRFEGELSKVNSELRDNETRLREVLSKGDPNKTADSYAMKIKTLSTKQEVVQRSLETAEFKYNSHLEDVKKAKEELDNYASTLDTLKYRKEIADASRELKEVDVNLGSSESLREELDALERGIADSENEVLAHDRVNDDLSDRTRLDDNLDLEAIKNKYR